MNCSVYDLVGKFGVTVEDGQKVHNYIHALLKSDQQATLDFSGVEVIASPFLNTAIGSLLEDVSADDLNRLLKMENISPAGAAVLRRVIENSTQYYNNAAVRRAVDSTVTEYAEAM